MTCVIDLDFLSSLLSTLIKPNTRSTISDEAGMQVLPSFGKDSASLMGSYGQSINLKQYRCLDGKWQFVPVVKENGKPNPKLILIDGEPVGSKGGVFYLDWRENGKRRTRKVGTSPREALDAWQPAVGVPNGT
jgi:hypothetical protein